MRFIAITALGIVMGLAVSTSQAQRTTRATLDRVMPEMRLTNVALVDAIEFIRDVSGANLHVNWRALEEVGVTRDTNINVRLRSVSLRKVLNLILGDAGSGDLLAYQVDQGVIEITTKDLADRKLFTKVYPVQDLLMEIPDFDNAPQFSLSDSNSGTGSGSGRGSGSGYGSSSSGGLWSGSGTGSGSGSGYGTEENTRTRQERADDLILLIMDIIRPDIWRDNGGPASIRFWSGNLIVTAPRSVHEALGGPID